jgi:cohesin loading factor subunit SCC2
MTADQLKRLLEWNGNSVSAFLLEGVRPFTMQSWDMSIREQALRSVGEISQQSPKMIIRADVEKAFKLVFINQDNQDLKRAVLIQFRDFFASAERRSETGAEIAVGQGAVAGAARLDTSFAASDNDSATLHLAQKFLSDIVGIALGKTDDLALLATNIIISISRQGLVHPKEVGPALIALETSPVPHISQKAFLEHQKIHLQHETMFEKEYMTAVAQAYAYQRDVCDDSHGLTNIAFKPKMHLLFNVLKMGGRKTLKKFLTNICKQIDFELPKLDCTGAVPDVVLFTRFCLENLGLFDYAKVDEIVQLTSSLEGIVLKHTGPAVALAIETEMPQHIPHPVQQPQEPGVDDASVLNVTLEDLPPAQFPEARLRQLTVACMILQMMWETRSFIKRIYNMQGKITAKDFQKPATRMNFVSGKELWDRMSNIMTSLDSRDNMIKQCRDFAELLEVDREAKFDDEEDASDQLAKAAAGYETPDEEANGSGPAAPTSGRGRKRKGSVVGGSTPKKAKGRSKKTQSRKGSKTPDRDDWD